MTLITYYKMANTDGNNYKNYEDLNNINVEYSENDEKCKKLKILSKLEELKNLGHNFNQYYSFDNSLDELEIAYKNNYHLYENKNIIENINCRKNNFFEHEIKYYVEDTYIFANIKTDIFFLMKEASSRKYIIKYEPELWKKMTQICFYFLKSERFRNFIETGFEGVKSISYSKINDGYISFKNLFLKSSNSIYFAELKKSIMDENNKLISEIENDDEIEKENLQEIIKLLMKINSIIAEIKETVEEITIQIDNIVESKFKIIEFMLLIKEFILINVESVTKNDIFYYKYIVPLIEKKINSQI